MLFNKSLIPVDQFFQSIPSRCFQAGAYRWLGNAQGGGDGGLGFPSRVPAMTAACTVVHLRQISSSRRQATCISRLTSSQGVTTRKRSSWSKIGRAQV